MYATYAIFFTQWMYEPGFPCQKSVLIFTPHSPVLHSVPELYREHYDSLSSEISCLGNLHSADPWSWGWWPHRCQDCLVQVHTVLSAAEYFWNASIYLFFHCFFGSGAFCKAVWARLLSPELVAWLFQVLSTHITTEGNGKDECSENLGHQLWKHMQYLYLYITFSPVGVAGKKRASDLEGFCFALFCFLSTSILFSTIQLYKKYLLLTEVHDTSIGIYSHLTFVHVCW